MRKYDRKLHVKTVSSYVHKIATKRFNGVMYRYYTVCGSQIQENHVAKRAKNPMWCKQCFGDQTRKYDYHKRPKRAERSAQQGVMIKFGRWYV